MSEAIDIQWKAPDAVRDAETSKTRAMLIRPLARIGPAFVLLLGLGWAANRLWLPEFEFPWGLAVVTSLGLLTMFALVGILLGLVSSTYQLAERGVRIVGARDFSVTWPQSVCYRRASHPEASGCDCLEIFVEREAAWLRAIAPWIAGRAAIPERRKRVLPLPEDNEQRKKVIRAVDERVPTCDGLVDERVQQLERDAQEAIEWHGRSKFGAASGFMLLAFLPYALLGGVAYGLGWVGIIDSPRLWMLLWCAPLVFVGPGTAALLWKDGRQGFAYTFKVPIALGVNGFGAMLYFVVGSMAGMVAWSLSIGG